MFDVFYCVILNTIVYRFANGDQPNLVENDHQSTWAEAFGACDDQTYWHQIFNGCQPESCNASSVAETIINKPMLGRNHEYWIYGYVLRTPVIVNLGCYSLNSSSKNELHRGIISFELNSAFECSQACPDVTVHYIFLRERECLCIPKDSFTEQQYNYNLLEVNTGTCNLSCDGNGGDVCGGVSFDDKKELYSVYQIITRRGIDKRKFGDTCAVIKFNDKMQQHFLYTTCNSEWMYICQEYILSDKIYKDKCPDKTASWYSARDNCHHQGLQLRSYTSSSFSSDCAPSNQTYWIGNHVAEKIIWANDSLPEDPLCLKLVVTKYGSRFGTDNCNKKMYSLCYTQQQTSSGKNDAAYITSVSKGLKGHITLRSPVNAESDSNEDTTDFIPIVAGCVGGFVVIVIVVIIVFIITRRKKSNNKHLNSAVDQEEHENYSQPFKNIVTEENTKLVNVTEEGIYNHLGDSEKLIEMKPQDSSIYDVTGDDEYHVFTGSEKQDKFKDDDDLYDHGAASDVYNSLNDTVTPNRPESDTYNVINAK